MTATVPAIAATVLGRKCGPPSSRPMVSHASTVNPAAVGRKRHPYRSVVTTAANGIANRPIVNTPAKSAGSIGAFSAKMSRTHTW